MNRDGTSYRTTQNGTIKNHQSVPNNHIPTLDKELYLLSEKIDLSPISNNNKNDQETQKLQVKDAISDIQLPDGHQTVISLNATPGLLASSKMNNRLLIDEERMILDVIFSGQMQDLKHFSIKFKSLNYACLFEPLLSIDQKVTPLIIAVYCGKIENVKQLFSIKSQGICVNFPTKPKGLTPLMVACQRGQFEIAQYLIQLDADVSLKTSNLQNAMSFCFLRLEEENNNKFENQNLCFKMASVLLSSGIDINETIDQNDGFSLLLRACAVVNIPTLREKQVNLAQIQFLVQNGADLQIKDNWGKNCFDLIETHPFQEEILKLLNPFDQSIFSGYRIDLGKLTEQQIGSDDNLPQFGKIRKKSQNMLTSTSTNQYINPLLSTQFPVSQQLTSHSYSIGAKPYPQKYQTQTAIDSEENKNNMCCSFFSFF